VLGRGRTGSGKTFAFALPVVARLAADRQRPAAGRPLALVLAPTRELAAQIADSLRPLAKADRLSLLTIFGGVNQNPQVRALRDGVDILVATPGRLLDLRDQGHLALSDVAVTVIDEADHMSDMGFLPGVKKILAATPTRSQRLLFSATLDNAVNVLVKQFLHDPVVHEADSAQSPVASMQHHVLTVDPADRLDVVADLTSAPGRTIVFTRTKHGAKKLAKQLVARGIPAVDLHGNLNQNARTRHLEAFGSVASKRSLPPTSPPVGFTSTTSRSSCTPIRPPSTRRTCTVRDAPRGPGTPGRSSPSPRPNNAGTCAD
jgi:superfamily II DNA/RNA helicase